MFSQVPEDRSFLGLICLSTHKRPDVYTIPLGIFLWHVAHQLREGRHPVNDVHGKLCWVFRLSISSPNHSFFDVADKTSALAE
jgi:hypothetical protein